MFIVKWTSLTLSFVPKWSPKEQKCQVIFFAIAISNHENCLFFFVYTKRSSSKRWTYWLKVSAVKVFTETLIKGNSFH